MAVAAVFVAAATVPLAPDMVRIVAGDEFADSTVPLRILMLGAAFAFVASLLLFALIALDRQRNVLVLTLVALVVNLGLNLALIPSFSYTAAAAIATATQFVIVIGALYLIWRSTAFVPSPRVILRATFAGAVVFVVLGLLPTSFAVSLVSGTILYALLLLVLRIDRELDLGQLLRRA
jgi:O-antigen/teichoic acid export membrane protein